MKRTSASAVLVLCGIAAACGTKSPNASAPHDAGGPDGDADAGSAGCPTIQTANGPLLAGTDGVTCNYKGIPYAAPPTGDLRWKAPQPAASWTTPRPSFPASGCPQAASQFGTASSDEDCLYLNVWAPISPAAKPAPVMVFVHGGSFLYGSGTFPLYDGSNLAAATGNLVVTLNYRLGALGFLSNPALRAEDPTSPSSGEYGVEDQIAAFQWVQANIAAFGGDPTNVTIFGESAGGTSMFLHLVSPKSAGLFARVIVESGAAASGSPAVPTSAADAQGASFATALGCTDASTIMTCLRGQSVASILGTGGSETSPTFWPAVNGFIVPADPVTLFASGAINKVPTLLGNNKNEGIPLRLPVPPTDDASYLAFANTLVAGQGSAIVAEYPISSFNGSYEAAAVQAMTDGVFLCPTRRVARGIVATGTPVFRYDFVHVMEDPPFLNLGAFHGSELVFVFGNDIAGAFGLEANEVPLSQLMMAYWGSMAASGNPNGSNRFAWPAYEMTTEPEIVLDTTQSTETKLEQSQCDFWDGIEQ